MMMKKIIGVRVNQWLGRLLHYLPQRYREAYVQHWMRRQGISVATQCQLKSCKHTRLP